MPRSEEHNLSANIACGFALNWKESKYSNNTTDQHFNDRKLANQRVEQLFFCATRNSLLQVLTSVLCAEKFCTEGYRHPEPQTTINLLQ